MKKSGTNSQDPSWEQLGSLAGFILDFLSKVINFSQVEYWLGHKTELKKKLREVFSITDEFSEIRDEWQKFYKIHFNWDVDFSQVIIPPKPSGKWRLIFIPKGMNFNLAFSICEKLFKIWKYTENLNQSITKNIRNTDSHYVVWVRDEVEPDQEFLGKSTRQADPDMKIGITLLERIIFEIKYFTETGNHLDINGITFCSGSSNAIGDISRADLDSTGKFGVHLGSQNYCNSKSGIRSVVSLGNFFLIPGPHTDHELRMFGEE